MSVTFTHLSTVLVLPTPDYPEDPGEDLQQTRMRTMGSRILSVTHSSGTLKDPILHYTDLSETDRNALASFIFNTVIGATNPFQYEDHEAVTETVKYMGGMPGQQVDFNQWVVDLQLAVVPT